MTRRLVLFSSFFILILAGLELFVRANGASFEALSDRLAFRIRVFERSPDDTAVLFLGTSRFADAIDQTVFGEEAATRIGEEVWAVNGATGGINLEEMKQFAEVAVKDPHLPRIVVEASQPAVTRGPGSPAFTNEGETNLQESEGTRFPDRIENLLQEWFLEHSSLVRYRKALRPRTFLRLGVLYTANLVDPGKWSRKGFVRELLTSSDFEISEEEFNAFQPRRIESNVRLAEGEITEEDFLEDPFYLGMLEIAAVLQGTEADVIWVAPPVMPEMQESESGPLRLAIYKKIASDFGFTILDYSRVAFEGSLFRDKSHLNEKGRTLFSRLVARDLTADW